MGSDIDVSIIIPTYNRLWSLPRAIKSCLNTQCKTEIIVIDDGSSDGTWQWLQNQDNAKSFYQNNQGQTYAINYGVSKATGKYIRFLDSDDFLIEGIIDKQFRKAEETSADLIYSKVNDYDQQTSTIKEHEDINPWADFLTVQLSKYYGSHFLGMLFKTDWVRKVPRRPEFALREDRMFLLEYGLLNPKIELVSGCAGYWVQHLQQMQANYNGQKAQVTNWQHLNIIKQILNTLKLSGRLTRSRKQAACTILWPLAHWTAKDFLNEAINITKLIYELDPTFEVPETGILRWLYTNIGFKRTEQILRIRRSIINVFR